MILGSIPVSTPGVIPLWQQTSASHLMQTNGILEMNRKHNKFSLELQSGVYRNKKERSWRTESCELNWIKILDLVFVMNRNIHHPQNRFATYKHTWNMQPTIMNAFLREAQQTISTQNQAPATTKDTAVYGRAAQGTRACILPGWTVNDAAILAACEPMDPDPNFN